MKPLAPPNPKLPNYHPHRKRGGELDWFELARELVLTQQQFEDEFGSGLPDKGGVENNDTKVR